MVINYSILVFFFDFDIYIRIPNVMS